MPKRKIKTPRFDPTNPKLFYVQRSTGGPFSNYRHGKTVKNLKKMNFSAATIQRAFRSWKARKLFKAKLDNKQRIAKEIMLKNSLNPQNKFITSTPSTKSLKVKRRSQSYEEPNPNFKLKREYYEKAPIHSQAQTLSSLYHRNKKVDKTTAPPKLRTSRKRMFS